MIESLAPTLRRGCSWVWLSLVSLGLLAWPALSLAQPPRPKSAAEKGAPAAKKEAAKDKDEKKDDAEKDKEEPTAEQSGVNPGGTVEAFKDPRAEKALATFKSVTGLRDAPGSVINQVRAMAATPGQVDRELIQRFVDAMAYRLVDRGNINGLIAPPPNLGPNAPTLRAIKETAATLYDVLGRAKLANNAAFLTAYKQALVATMPKLLDNNLVPRLEAMIILGQTADPNALPVFVGQLKDRNQTVWVKLWAAKGLSTMVDGGTRVDAVLNAQQAAQVGKVLVDFLEGEKDAPWPAQLRALEALGAMRQAALPVSPGKVDMANAAMQLLIDPESGPEVRAAAAWALGMLRVSAPSYNYKLVAYSVGQLTVDLGDDAATGFKENMTQSEYLAGLLISPVFQAFNGVDGARESGLLKQPGLGEAQTFIKQVADYQLSVARAAVELVRAPAGQYGARTKDLADRVATLREFLEKNPPKDFHLVPGGAEFKPAPPAAKDKAAPEEGDAAKEAAPAKAAAAPKAAPATKESAPPAKGAGAPRGR